jgi:hypothetical protein
LPGEGSFWPRRQQAKGFRKSLESTLQKKRAISGRLAHDWVMRLGNEEHGSRVRAAEMAVPTEADADGPAVSHESCVTGAARSARDLDRTFCAACQYTLVHSQFIVADRNRFGDLRSTVSGGVMFAVWSRKFQFALMLATALSVSMWPAASEAYTPEQQAACTDDAFRLCGADIPDVDRVTACMARKQDQLSPGCRVYFQPSEPAVRAGMPLSIKPSASRKPVTAKQ